MNGEADLGVQRTKQYRLGSAIRRLNFHQKALTILFIGVTIVQDVLKLET